MSMVNDPAQADKQIAQCLEIKAPLTKVIQSTKEWKAFWAEQSKCQDESGKSISAPKYDFKKKQLVLVALGEKRTGGYGAKIDFIQTKKIGNKTVTVVEYQEMKPAASCIVTDALTYPLAWTWVEHSKKPIQFVSKEVIRNCD